MIKKLAIAFATTFAVVFSTKMIVRKIRTS